MKIQCQCGAKYEFQIRPEMAREPVRFVCPTCGYDASEFVNSLVRQELGANAPIGSVTSASPLPPQAPAVARPAPMRIHIQAPQAASAGDESEAQPARQM